VCVCVCVWVCVCVCLCSGGSGSIYILNSPLLATFYTSLLATFYTSPFLDYILEATHLLTLLTLLSLYMYVCIYI